MQSALIFMRARTYARTHNQKYNFLKIMLNLLP